jgi:hypothetical protein
MTEAPKEQELPNVIVTYSSFYGWMVRLPEEICNVQKEFGPIEYSPKAKLDAARRELTAKINQLEQLLNDAHKHCLCARFETKGFDYGEEHRTLGEPDLGARWLTPRDIIDIRYKMRNGNVARRKLECEKGGEGK